MTEASPQTTISLPPEAASVSAARRFAAEANWPGAKEQRDRLAILVSEVTTNAVLHARTRFSITLRSSGSRLRVAVEDESPQLPIKKQYGPAEPTGRGLKLVSSLASAWGVDPKPGGKIVWFELEADTP
jgi:anti-sigma regulatory factor (Ser/Thr protein kinase)